MSFLDNPGITKQAADAAYSTIAATTTAQSTANTAVANAATAQSTADAKPDILTGLDASKPAASSRAAGTLYFSTDTQKIYRTTGAAWVVVDNNLPVPVADATARNALTAFTGLQVTRLDAAGIIETYDGTAWYRPMERYAAPTSTGILTSNVQITVMRASSTVGVVTATGRISFSGVQALTNAAWGAWASFIATAAHRPTYTVEAAAALRNSAGSLRSVINWSIFTDGSLNLATHTALSTASGDIAYMSCTWNI